MPFRSKIRCPVDAATKQWIDRRWTWLTQQFGREGLRKRPVILPHPKFFPDPYRGRPEDVEGLLWRVAEYMEIDQETIELKLYEEARLHHTEEHHGSAGLYF